MFLHTPILCIYGHTVLLHKYGNIEGHRCVQHCWKCKRELQQSLSGQGTSASHTDLCMLQYSTSMAALCHYMFLPSCPKASQFQWVGHDSSIPSGICQSPCNWPRRPSGQCHIQMIWERLNFVAALSSLYVNQVTTTVTTFKELQLQRGIQIYLPSLFTHSIILSKFKTSFPW